MNLPNFRQSPSLAAILRDLSTWSVTDINQAGRSKTVTNTYESSSNKLYFQFKRQNLKFFVKLTIPMRPSLPTIQTLKLVDSTVRNNLCHPSSESNVKYKSITQLLHLRGNIRLVFWLSDRQEWCSGSDRHQRLPHKHDRWPAAEWKQYGSVVRGGVWWVRADYQKIFGNIRTYALKYRDKH